MIKEGDYYDQDMLKTRHNHEFMNDPAFQAAYARGVKAAGMDYMWHWRAYVGLWAARCAAALPGDFVECGVAKGFLSSAIMHDLAWDTTGRTFYLLDTFCGLDQRYVSDQERAEGAIQKNAHMIEIGLYPTGPEAVIANFSEWERARVIVGSVPDTLDQIDSEEIAYLHLDMNCAPPEIATIRFLWDRLTTGALVLLDDYAFYGYRHQKLAMDEFAAANNVSILSLPTGQGLIVRPPRSSASSRRFSFRRMFG